MRPPDLLVRLELAVRRGRSVSRLGAVHTLRGRTVHVLTVDGSRQDVRTIGAQDWACLLAGTCRVAPPDDAVPARLRSGLELPWDLVLGTGAARSAHREDLYAELLGRAAPGAREGVERLHVATCGRLRAVGTAPGGRRVGWLAWVLFADGWHALTPCVAGAPASPGAMVRIERREPDDLAHDVARWAAGVVR